MPHRKLKITILDTVLITPNHAAGFQEVPELAEIIAVCDPNRENAETLAILFDTHLYTDYRDMLANREIDLVDVLLPHHQHNPVALEVIASRKHLLLEKPVAVSYE